MTDAPVVSLEESESGSTQFSGVPIVDCDVHPVADEKLMPFLPDRWRRHIELVDLRNAFTLGVKSPHRRRAARLDAYPPNGGNPGSDPEFAAEQLLDKYGIAASVLNPLEPWGGANAPVELDVAVARATNDWLREHWLESDERWLSSIRVSAEQPDEAVREIVRCRELHPRYAQVHLPALTERAHGDPKYWPIYEAASEYGLPISVHAGITSVYRQWSPVGDEGSYYFESRGAFAPMTRTILSSLVFEGVFDRFPKLKFLFVEQGYAWIVPFMWRLDASWRVMREEVPHLDRKPSDYIRDHVYFSTQPAFETETPRQLNELYAQLETAGMGDNLLFASDYPHWDMDTPFDGFPKTLTPNRRAAILSRTAVGVFGLDPHSLERDSAKAAA